MDLNHTVDPCSGAYTAGEWSAVAASIAVGGGATAKLAGGWRKIPFYELGQKWLPRLASRAGRVARWDKLAPVTKGEIILKAAKGNWLKAFAPETIFKPFGPKALATGPAPLGWGGFHALAQIIKNHFPDDCE